MLPEDLYKMLRQTHENDLKRLEGKKKLIDVTFDLRGEGFLEFLESVIEAYSDCSSNAAKRIAESVSKFDSYTLIAKHAGLHLKKLECDTNRISETLELAEGDSKKFLKFITLGTLTAECHGVLGRLEAVYPALLLHALYGPLPPKLPILLATRQLPEEKLDDYFRHELSRWFSQEKEDLLMEALRELALGDKLEEVETGIYADIVRDLRQVIKKQLRGCETAESLAMEASHLILEELNSLTDKLSPEYWRRVAYIIGSIVSGYSFGRAFSEYTRLTGVPKIAEKCEELDSLLLAGNDVPPFIRSFIALQIVKEIEEDKFPLKPIKESHEMVGEAKKLLQREKYLCLIPYSAGLALATFKHQPSDALYLLNWVVSNLELLADLEAVAKMLHAIGKALNWPGELACPLFIIINEYAEYEPKLCELLESSAQTLLMKGKLEAWSKVHLAKALAELAGLKGDVCLSDKAFSLLEEIKREDTLMGHIASAYVNNYLADMYMRRGELSKAEKYLNGCNKALESAKQASRSGLSENVKKYLIFMAAEPPEEVIQLYLQRIEAIYKFRLAKLYTDKGLLEDDKEKLEEAEKIYCKLAEEDLKLEHFSGYLVDKKFELKMRVLLADSFSEELCQDFREFWEAARERASTTREMSPPLGCYLVALALTDGNWRELLDERGFLLRCDLQQKTATLLLLSLIAQQKTTLIPSNSEIYEAIETGVLPELRPALRLSLSLINEEEARKQCVSKILTPTKEIPEIDKQTYEKLPQFCILSVDAVLGRDVNGNFRNWVLNQLKAKGVDIEKINEEKLNERELLELIAVNTSMGSFILLLKALVDGNYRLARAHALRASIALSLFGKLYDALKAEELNDKVKLYLAKLYYWHF